MFLLTKTHKKHTIKSKVIMTKRLLIFSLFAIFITSCKNNELSGTWMLAFDYEMAEPESIKNSSYHDYTILTFNEDELTRIEINSVGEEKIITKNFKHNSDKLFLFDNNNKTVKKEFRFKFLSADSIIISNLYGASNKGFVRVPEELKNNDILINITNETYLRKISNRTDTIKFFSNRVYKSSSFNVINSKEKMTKLKWKRIKFNGFDILHLDYFNPYFIVETKDRTVRLRDHLNQQEVFFEHVSVDK